MSRDPLLIAVVGHTNTGKTSLLRTLMRDESFGEVSDRPAVTRSVEAAVLHAGESSTIELFDTPGLEDSIGLLEHLESLRGGRRVDGIEVIEEFLAGAAAHGAYTQEAKALRQVLASDVALYVIDVRERVLGKHRDELAILAQCARPVVPVLNFTASPEARTAEWREHLSRVNLHAVAEFDTVVFNAADERRLFEKIATLADEHRETLEAFVADRQDQRSGLIRSSSLLLAEMLIDVASYHRVVPVDDRHRAGSSIESLKALVRGREQKCVDALLALHRFRRDDVRDVDLPIEDGAWGLDLFSGEAVKQFGIKAGGGAAAGAMVGLTVDAMLGGLSLGAGAAAGAAIGGLLGSAGSHGRKVLARLRGRTELRCDDGTLQVLALRQIELVRALLRRGHASMDAIPMAEAREGKVTLPREIMDCLRRARGHSKWSRLESPVVESAGRSLAVEDLAGRLAPVLA